MINLAPAISVWRMIIIACCLKTAVQSATAAHGHGGYVGRLCTMDLIDLSLRQDIGRCRPVAGRLMGTVPATGEVVFQADGRWHVFAISYQVGVPLRLDPARPDFTGLAVSNQGSIAHAHLDGSQDMLELYKIVLSIPSAKKRYLEFYIWFTKTKIASIFLNG
jgi:hypothetical protein